MSLVICRGYLEEMIVYDLYHGRVSILTWVFPLQVTRHKG